MTRLFKSAADRGLTSSRYARLGQAPTGDLQKSWYANDAPVATDHEAIYPLMVKRVSEEVALSIVQAK